RRGSPVLTGRGDNSECRFCPRGRLCDAWRRGQTRQSYVRCPGAWQCAFVHPATAVAASLTPRLCIRGFSHQGSIEERVEPAMAPLVMKFGGTSVADLDRIRNVARHVKREIHAGHEVAVVVSAMAGTTNDL